MKPLLSVLALSFISVLWVSSTHASIIHFQSTLDGAQAGTASPGTGFADLALDDVANSLAVNLTYSGLLSPATNAHIHCCAPPGSAAGVIIPFIPEGFVTGTTSGSFSAVIPITPVFVADIESGLSYINIHTAVFPAGEIRGQIVAVPEPSTLSLLVGTCAVGLLFSRRWRAPCQKMNVVA